MHLSKDLGKRCKVEGRNVANLVFSIISFMAMLEGDSPSESVKVRYSPPGARKS